MKIALFSDIHGNLTGLNAVEAIETLRARGVRMVRGDSDTEDELRDRLSGRGPAPRFGPAYYEAMLEWRRPT